MFLISSRPPRQAINIGLRMDKQHANIMDTLIVAKVKMAIASPVKNEWEFFFKYGGWEACIKVLRNVRGQNFICKDFQ